jgi:transcriptional adapter 2-alpha
MMKIDVNKAGKIFDFLVSSGILCLSYDPTQKAQGGGKEGVEYGQVNVAEVYPS